MRARLVVSTLIAASCFEIVSIASLALAQTTPAPTQAPRTTPAPTGAAQAGPSTPPPAATNAPNTAKTPAAPPPAAPVTPPAAAAPPASSTPAAAAPPASSTPAAATPAPAAGTPPGAQPSPEGFDLAAALRGTGAALTSDEAAKRAAKTAPSVARAEAAARQAAFAASEANVAVWPRLELEARYTLLSDVELPDTLPAAFRSTFEVQQHTGLLEARLTYPVSALFFSIIPLHKAAQKTADAQQLTSKVQAQTVGLQAREAFYNYARARAALMVAKSAQAQAEAHRRDVDALVTAGSLAKVELMRADAQVASAKVAVSRTAGSVAIARSALYTVTHLEGTEDVTVNEDLEQELPPLSDTTDALLAKALSNRSELKQLRLSLQAIEHNVDAVQGQQLPQLVVGGTIDYANPNQRYLGGNDRWNESWAVFASVTWSPNDWATNSSAADQARAQLAQTLADLEQLEDALRIEVTQAYEDYNAARASLESARVGIAAAEESYRVRREQFRAGAAVATDVIDAEAELRTARLDLVNAIIDMRIAKARLDRAVEA